MEHAEIASVSCCEPAGQSLPETTGGNLPVRVPCGRALILRAGGQGPGGASNLATAIAVAIINSSVVAHSIIITAIVTVFVLSAALALE